MIGLVGAACLGAVAGRLAAPVRAKCTAPALLMLVLAALVPAVTAMWLVGTGAAFLAAAAGEYAGYLFYATWRRRLAQTRAALGRLS